MGTRRLFTPAEDARLRDLWDSPKGMTAIGELLGRHPASVLSRARVLDLPPRPYWTTEYSRRWTEADVAELRRMVAAGERVAAIAAALDRKESQIRVKCHELQLNLRQVYAAWTPAKDAMLRAGWSSPTPLMALARELKRSRVAVVARADALGLPPRARLTARGAEWTVARDAALLALWDQPKLAVLAIARQMGCAKATILQRAKVLGLKPRARAVRSDTGAKRAVGRPKQSAAEGTVLSQRILELRRAGGTNRQIRDLLGCSQSQIGRVVRRAGLQRTEPAARVAPVARVAPAARVAPVARVAKPAAVAKPVAAPLHVVFDGTADCLDTRPAPVPALARSAVRVAPRVSGAAPRRHLFQPSTCQWIAGDPRQDPSMCGAPVREGSAYCGHHHARAYAQPAAPVADGVAA